MNTVPIYERHPFSAMFPLLSKHSDQRKALKEDIKVRGLKTPIVIFNGQILDGWNRYTVIRELVDEGHKVEGVDFIKRAGTEAQALAFVVSENFARRHLTDKERSAIALNIAMRTVKHGGDRRSDQVRNHVLDTTAKIAAATGVNARTLEGNIQKAKKADVQAEWRDQYETARALEFWAGAVIDRLGWIAPVGQASQKTEGADDDKIISSVGDLSDTELVRRLEAEHEHTRAAMIAEGVTIHSIPPFADILAKFQSAGEAEAPKIHTDASRAEIAWLDAKIAELEGDAEALRETLDSTPAADISFRSTTREALGKAEVGLVLARARRAARAA